MEFTSEIKNWVTIDNKLMILNQQAKQLRDEKKQLETNILEHVETNELHNTGIKISDGILRFIKVKKNQTLSFKFLEECLHKLFQDETKVKDIIKYIKSSRESVIINDIKRTYNSE